MPNTVSKKVFEAIPELKPFLSELGMRYASPGHGEFHLYEPGQYRHIFWKPGHPGDDMYEYRPYYVYTPAIRYGFIYHEFRKPVFDADGRFSYSSEITKSLLYNDAKFVTSHKRGHRSEVHNVTPNEQCLGYAPMTITSTSDFESFLDTFWNNGWNIDNGYGGRFWFNVSRIEPVIPVPSYKMFERWESMTPQQVLRCAKR